MFSNYSLEITLATDFMELDELDSALLDVRSHFHPNHTIPNSNESTRDTLATPSSSIVVVIDTNIFIRDLNLISSLALLLSSAESGVILYIPSGIPRNHNYLVVVRELDGLKLSPNSSVKNASIKANSWLLHQLQLQARVLFGQRVSDTLTKVDPLAAKLTCPDDDIIEACLFAKSRVSTTATVFLLTRDKNLAVKGLINEIVVLSEWTTGAESLLKRVSPVSYLAHPSRMLQCPLSLNQYKPNLLLLKFNKTIESSKRDV
jgi:hypothetical protein